MANPVIAIGLDAADPTIMERWLQAGHLPNLAQLQSRGSYTRLHNTVQYGDQRCETASTERLWVMFGSACEPQKTTYWGPVEFHPDSYGVTHDTVNGAYSFQDYAPFYALGADYKVAAFDVPVSALNEGVNGLQVLGWGGHAPHTPSHSQPSELFGELTRQYGKNPVLHQDYGYWWDQAYSDRIRKGLKRSIADRAKICRTMLNRESWDLFLTVFGETHSAGHDFLHLSQSDNPLYPYLYRDEEPMLEAFKQVDRAIGEIVDGAPEDAQFVVFSVHGMGNNVTDMYSMTFLPELLYRYNFPGKWALGRSPMGRSLKPPVTTPRRKTWTGEIWQKRFHPNPIKHLLQSYTPSRFDEWINAGQTSGLRSPYELRRQRAALDWMPATWYSDLWPSMKAFALPAFAAGHVRINVKGREQYGCVAAQDYEAVCGEITEQLLKTVDSRTGQPIVKDIVRTRSQADCTSLDPTLPDADLVIFWQERPTDTVEHPDLGRIGPLTYFRTGGHRPDGFCLLSAQDSRFKSTALASGQAMDLGPTILDLMGAPIPAHLDGHSLLKKDSQVDYAVL